MNDVINFRPSSLRDSIFKLILIFVNFLFDCGFPRHNLIPSNKAEMKGMPGATNGEIQVNINKHLTVEELQNYLAL